MLNLKLRHLDEVLPEGHHTPALKTGELCNQQVNTHV